MATEAEPVVGRRVGDHVVTRLLGHGGSLTVYEGTHAELGTRVALRSVRHPSPSAKERFDDAARTLAGLQHPNIVARQTIPDVDRSWIVIELAEGEDLETRLQKTERLPAGRCLPWFVDACRGLEYAHDRGVIHGDVKPSNLLVPAAGPARLLGFDARLTDERRAQAGLRTGTIAYLPKEQLLGGPPDARSDVYSLGVTLYEALTGKLPFYDEEERELVRQIVETDPVPPRRHVPAISPEVERVVLRAIAREPASRYQSAAELEGALLALASLDAVASSTATVAPPSEAPPGDRRSPRQVAGLALVVVGLGAMPLVALGTGWAPVALLGVGAALLLAGEARR